MNYDFSEHCTECPLHEDYILPSHLSDCDSVVYPGEYCSCDMSDVTTECQCDSIESEREEEAAERKRDMGR